MVKTAITKLTRNFEDYVHIEGGVEFWFARDLMILLGHNKRENFVNVIEKAKEICKNTGNIILDHFLEVRKKVNLGSGNQREIEDLGLTRYAYYLIAQNEDSRKEEIAFAQSCFAVQTRKQELIEQKIALSERLVACRKLTQSGKELSELIYERGVGKESKKLEEEM